MHKDFFIVELRNKISEARTEINDLRSYEGEYDKKVTEIARQLIGVLDILDSLLEERK